MRAVAVSALALNLAAPITAVHADTTAAELLALYTPPDGQLEPVMAALAAGTITTNVPSLEPGQLVPEPVQNGYVITGQELEGFDVTNTPVGQAEIAAFVTRLRLRGELRASATTFRVFSLPDVANTTPGDVTHALPIDTAPVDNLFEGESLLGSGLIVPGCSLPVLVGATVVDGGGIVVKTLFETMPTRQAASPSLNVPEVQNPTCDFDLVPSTTLGEDQPDPGDSENWTPRGGLGCLERKQNNTAWFDVCSWWYHRSDDGNAHREAFALKQYGTGKSKSTWTLDDLEVESWRKENTADQDWLDWGPRNDSDNGNCQSRTIGVNVNAAYVEHTTTQCDEWDIDKGSAPADFANHWQGDAIRKERDTAMVIATNTPNGEWPVDYVDFDYYAW